MELDHIDFQILRILSENARIQWKELGEQIHMTGQAVGNRIKKLEESGVIKGYSAIVDETKMGLTFTAFIIFYMKTANHHSFIRLMDDRREVLEVHRVSGEGCYHLKIKTSSQEQLNRFLDDILEYGNYTLHLSIQEIKKQNSITTT
ncbi:MULTISPECIES: Lrp/AsnC family transcriptional regulator [Paenibacillus]|uniref:Transcriptional regulator n=1 Tax=Paenibacillus amylolyticus TaxID=1451 RepID=A0A1R1C0B9_PAEAM|nr:MULTISPECIES: Lrp/AsnC family transcriptional regulator [Paenibacillus]MBD8836885.1 Lrp/AsnC family transcriptional regulator [Paenibacillus sp. CFBP 13594]OMF15531.1 transcriptional regulator [Paenibacillus amylolyticus]PRA07856.1 Lrp/AsnC family transcriptional regulator [Paenibacillus sp. MYb63]PRA51500.1 Lrp/AsnC family transcriptional regulator [Paenibacillus sp. MYb67]